MTASPPPGRGAWLIVFTLWLLVFSASSQIMIISPILPRIGEELGIADSVLGTLVTAYSLNVGIFAVLAGPVSDRIGRRRILLLGAAIMTVALALHALVIGYLTFLAVRVLAGMAGGILSGAAVSYIGDYFPYNRRGWATGWVMSGAAFGQILGIPLGVVLAGEHGFKAPFYIFAATMAATVVLLWTRVPQPRVRRSREPLTVAGAARGYLEMLRRPEITAAAGAFFLMFLGVSLYVVYFPTWLEAAHGATPSQIATLFLIGGVANVATGPQAGKLSDRIGRKGLVITSCVGLSIVMAGTVPLVRSMAWAYPLFFVTMMLVAMRVSPFSALLTALVEDQRRGSLLSLTVALGQVGFAVGAALSGIVYTEAGYGASASLAAVSVLGMGVVVGLFVPEPPREGDSAAEPVSAARAGPRRSS